ncbi:MAG: hypothetical protein ACI8PZ_003190 [Myxococcota bacterium]|jgi:hypothetical protein
MEAPMQRWQLTIALTGVALTSALLTPRLIGAPSAPVHVTVLPESAPGLLTVAPRVRSVEPAVLVEVPATPGAEAVIPEVTAPAPVAREPVVVEPKLPAGFWDDCPACGMG